MNKPRILPKGGNVHDVPIFNNRNAKARGIKPLTFNQLERMVANFHIIKNTDGFIPRVRNRGAGPDIGEVQSIHVSEDKEGIIADIKLYAPYVFQVVGTDVHMDGKPRILSDGSRIEPALHGLLAEGTLMENGVGALVKSWAWRVDSVPVGFDCNTGLFKTAPEDDGGKARGQPMNEMVIVPADILKEITDFYRVKYPVPVVAEERLEKLNPKPAGLLIHVAKCLSYKLQDDMDPEDDAIVRSGYLDELYKALRDIGEFG